ncbi:MAG: hypothetical protein GWM88_13550 [Pseudomonadales bacterium]|nr:hypothetical protein [Pseudomonadales bacterium]NIX08967.1 hypothetical protein [Pseudomonadales bacterium]
MFFDQIQRARVTLGQPACLEQNGLQQLVELHSGGKRKRDVGQLPHALAPGGHFAVQLHDLEVATPVKLSMPQQLVQGRLRDGTAQRQIDAPDGGLRNEQGLRVLAAGNRAVGAQQQHDRRRAVHFLLGGLGHLAHLPSRAKGESTQHRLARRRLCPRIGHTQDAQTRRRSGALGSRHDGFPEMTSRSVWRPIGRRWGTPITQSACWAFRKS